MAGFEIDENVLIRARKQERMNRPASALAWLIVAPLILVLLALPYWIIIKVILLLL